jgi:hypothetical protein
MPSTDRKLELQAKTSLAQTGSQPAVYAKGFKLKKKHLSNDVSTFWLYRFLGYKSICPA